MNEGCHEVRTKRLRSRNRLRLLPKISRGVAVGTCVRGAASPGDGSGFSVVPIYCAEGSAGARAFVGADQEVYGREGWRLDEASLLGACLVLALRMNRDVTRGLVNAKRLFAWLADKPLSREDALTLRAFRAYV